MIFLIILCIYFNFIHSSNFINICNNTLNLPFYIDYLYIIAKSLHHLYKCLVYHTILFFDDGIHIGFRSIDVFAIFACVVLFSIQLTLTSSSILFLIMFYTSACLLSTYFTNQITYCTTIFCKFQLPQRNKQTKFLQQKTPYISARC